MSSDNVDYIQLIKEKIGYEFKEEHYDLIQQAFVRRSYIMKKVVKIMRYWNSLEMWFYHTTSLKSYVMNMED